MPANLEIRARNPDCIRLIQITDTHILASSEDRFDGLDTTATLEAVIHHINREEQADLVLVTGDLVHDPVARVYDKLRELLMALELPVFCLPGNHDQPDLMHSLLNQDNVHTTRLIESGEWAIVLLDTTLAGSHSGSLNDGELAFLEQSLQQTTEKSVLICLHHPPVKIDSVWMDAMMLENPAALFSIIDSHSQTRALIWGHIHQEFRAKRGNVLLYGSPSSCIQFQPGSASYSRDELLGPGYSIVQLHGDGSVEIDVRRI